MGGKHGTINSGGRARDEDLDRQCLALKEAGNSYSAIAGQLGISRSAVAGRFYRMRRKAPTVNTNTASRARGPILARRRECVRALFEAGQKPKQIVGQVRREFGANMSIFLVYNDIKWLRAGGLIASQEPKRAQREDLDRQCVALREAGKSHSAIAGQLGISRSAVAGRFYRMRTQRKNRATGPVRLEPVRPERPSPAAERRRAVIEAGTCEKAPVAIIAPADNTCPPGAPTAVMTAKPGTCRWPIGEPRDADFRFCGAKALAGSSWCAGCATIAWPNGRTGGGAA